MTTLINKSNHPVNIKRISVRIWTLRDEIEACIQKRIEEAGSPEADIDIEDIKAFYSSLVAKPSGFDQAQKVASQESGSHLAAVPDEEPGDQDEPDELEMEMAQAMASEAASEMAEEISEEIGDELQSEGPDSASVQSRPQAKGFSRVKPHKDKIIEGFAFLSEIHMDQILFFGKKPYTTGQSIIIEFLIPNKFSCSAEVHNTLQIDRGSRIISETKPSHRVQASFAFLFDNERANLRSFLQSVEPEIPPTPKKLKTQDADDGGDDDFDDLGF